MRTLLFAVLLGLGLALGACTPFSPTDAVAPAAEALSAERMKLNDLKTRAAMFALCEHVSLGSAGRVLHPFERDFVIHYCLKER